MLNFLINGNNGISTQGETIKAEDAPAALRDFFNKFDYKEVSVLPTIETKKIYQMIEARPDFALAVTGVNSQYTAAPALESSPREPDL